MIERTSHGDLFLLWRHPYRTEVTPHPQIAVFDFVVFYFQCLFMTVLSPLASSENVKLPPWYNPPGDGIPSRSMSETVFRQG